MRARPAAWCHAPAFITFILLAGSGAYAQVVTNAQRDIEEQRRAQERETLQRNQLERTPDVRGAAAPTADIQRLPAQEAPCFVINQLELKGDTQSRFGWVLDSLAGPQADDAPLRRCIGAQGVGILLQRAQKALVAKGFVTSRILTEPQDLSKGSLALTVIPGRIRSIRFAPTADGENAPQSSVLQTALPAKPGDVLNLRDIEQALENLKRAPTADADIQITPANQPDQSDLVIKYQSIRPVRLSLSADDSGSKYTGRFQASATFSWDNPLGLNDLFYISQGSDAQGGDPGPRGNQSNTLHYSLPWGYWAFGLTMTDSSYYQRVTGQTLDYIYSGVSGSTEFKTSYLFYRDASTKETVYLKALERHARNYISGTEVQNQRRATALWELGWEHKAFIKEGTFQSTLAYKRGTRDFDAINAPEEMSGQGTARPNFYTADLNWSTPWTPWKLPLAYQANLRIQATEGALAAPDRFSLGGRYTVRGFDGESSISGDSGWLARQELGYNLGQSGGQMYLALDMGEVHGPNAAGLPERFIAGTALGWRIQTKKVQFDVFAGQPLQTASSLRTGSTAAGFSLNFSL